MLDVPHRFVFGDDDSLYLRDVEPQPWATPDEAATATINYTSGTTARPKGVQLTHRSLWLNATVFGLHTTISDRDVLLHTLPMFHVNGWGMPYGITGVGGRHIVLRQVDGAEILRRIERHGVTLLCGAPAVVNAVLDAAGDWDGEIPGAGSGADRGGRGAAAFPDHRARDGRTRVGVHPDLRVDRDVAAGHGEPGACRVGRTGHEPSRRASWCGPARRRSGCASRPTSTARC